MNKWMEQLSLWQWAVMQASAAFLSIAIGWSFIQSTHQDPWHWGRFGLWVHYGIGYIVFYTGFSTLFRYLRVRRRRKRERTTT